MFRWLLLIFLCAMVVGTSFLPPFPAIGGGAQNVSHLMNMAGEMDPSCHCPSHEEEEDLMPPSASGKIQYMKSCYGGFSDQAATIFKNYAPLAANPPVLMQSAVSESLLPASFFFSSLSSSPEEPPPRLA